MSYGDVRDEWKINEIERKADNANNRLHELDSLRSDVGSLERENREFSSIINELRYELEAIKEGMRELREEEQS